MIASTESAGCRLAVVMSSLSCMGCWTPKPCRRPMPSNRKLGMQQKSTPSAMGLNLSLSASNLESCTKTIIPVSCSYAIRLIAFNGVIEMSGIVRAYMYVPSLLSSGEARAKKVILAADAVYNEEQAISRVTQWREIYNSLGNIPLIHYEYIPPLVVM